MHRRTIRRLPRPPATTARSVETNDCPSNGIKGRLGGQRTAAGALTARQREAVLARPAGGAARKALRSAPPALGEEGDAGVGQQLDLSPQAVPAALPAGPTGA